MGCYLGSCLGFSWLLLKYPQPPLNTSDWLLGIGLTLIAAICQVFVVARSSTTGQRSDHLTLAPIFAAILLLPPPLLAFLLIVTFIPEWYLYRRSWFGQVFNISQSMLAALAAKLLLWYLTGYDRLTDPIVLGSLEAWSVLLTIPVFQLTHALMLSWALKLARGQSFRTSGMFTAASLLLEWSLTCLGLSFAICWLLDPLYSLLMSLPLILIFQALHVPNLKEEAATDPKTGLSNMRHFNESFKRDLERANRTGQAVSLLVCDLDYLRNINNTYGHQAGDIVLLGVADILRRHIRGSDVAARFGGEEFVVLLSDTGINGAYTVAERIRADLEHSRFDVGSTDGPISATMSIGVASYLRDGRKADQLMRAADLAVYQAKRDGRNRVVIAGHESQALASAWAREHLAAAEATTPSAESPRPFWDFIQQVTRASQAAAVRATPKITRVCVEEIPLTTAPNQAALPPYVLPLIGTILGAGLLGLWPGISTDLAPWWSLLLFAGLASLVAQFAIDTIGRGKLSVAAVPILGATFLYGEWGILVTTLAMTVTVAIKSGGPLYHWLFNFGTLLLASLGAHAIFIFFTGHSLAEATLVTTILPAIAAGLVYHGINQLLICVMRGKLERRQPWQIWQAEYRRLWPYYTVLSTLGIVLALSYRSFGALGFLTLIAPVGMMRFAFRQYLNRTKVQLKELQGINNQLIDSYKATLHTLTRTTAMRGAETEAHSQRVKRYCELIACRLQLSADQIEDLRRCALLHDIGKIGVPDAILLKPGRLTEEEQRLMRKHPETGYEMIRHIPFLANAAQLVLHHHEAFDGSGYPSGLAGTNIPLGARIFAIADTFDALTSDRPYRKALPLDAALAEIKRCWGTQFDPQLVDTFLAIPPTELMAAYDPITEPEPDLKAKLSIPPLELALET
jgi:diguanylate cyclase (GGDEF)-like protein/putative nucleotidyltransferase with HDIG domain